MKGIDLVLSMVSCLFFFPSFFFCILLLLLLPLLLNLDMIYFYNVLKLFLVTEYICCIRQFLYPSEEDLYKLVRFLVKRLSELPEEHGEAADKMNITTSTITKENDFKDSSSKEWTENANAHKADLNFDGARTKLEDLRLNTEMPESSSTRSADAVISGSHKTSLIQQRIGHNEEDMRSLQDQNESMERLVNSAIEASGNEESGGPMDDKHVLEFKHKLNDPRNQSSEVYV